MGTIIEFPADAASRRLGSTMDGAPREGMGTILILPVVRIEREPDETSGGSGPEEGTAPASPPPQALTIGHSICRRRIFRSGQVAGLLSRIGADAAAIGAGARRLQRRRFRPHPPGFPQRRHASLDRRRGDGKRRPACVAIPAHRRRTAASRSGLSADRAAAFASRLEERVRRLCSAAFAVAAEGGVRSHRLWTSC